MFGHGSEQVACSCVPQLYRRIFRTAGKDIGVGIEGDFLNKPYKYGRSWFGGGFC